MYLITRMVTGWRHTTTNLDSLSNLTSKLVYLYKLGGSINSRRTYSYLNGKKRITHKDLKSPIRVIEKRYYQNGKIKSIYNPNRLTNQVKYKEYSEEGYFIKKEK